ncbi:hypothetical protein MKX07_008218 [Trichoderma sp. CBMAI-0711]|nr:hypothetical protein MKX07_008218 [Trichoderma sp. CBMAI-0711]
MSTTKLPPITALKALEPRPGGHWTVQGQEGDAISLSYVLNGVEAMVFDLRQCKTEEDVRKFCSSFVYEYTDNASGSEWHHQPISEVPTENVHSHEAASLLYHSQSQSTMGQYSTVQIQQPPQEQLLFGAQAPMVANFEEKRVAALGIKSHLVEDLNAVSHLPLQFAYSDPRQIYNYASSTTAQPYQPEMPHLDYFAMTESETFDLDNPWDFDKMLGYKENEGDRVVIPAAGLPQPNNQYNPHNEFFYTF